LLQANYASQTNILADLTVDGVTYPTSECASAATRRTRRFPSGSQKVSLNIETDQVHPDQTVLGYKNLNFNNSFHDPTFCREVVYMNVLSKWIPCGRANHIVLTHERRQLGRLRQRAAVRQDDVEALLRRRRRHAREVREQPERAGLQYAGTNPSSYSGYEIKEAMADSPTRSES
jgi:hypothetical protein